MNSLNKFLTTHYDSKGKPLYEGGYDGCVKLYGDFKESLNYICESLLQTSLAGAKATFLKNKDKTKLVVGIIKYKNKNYNPFNNNCMQVSTRALTYGKFRG